MTNETPTFADKVSGLHQCMFTTITSEGSLVSRPMGVQKVEGDAVYFLTDGQHDKTREIQNDAEVNLAFVESSLWVSASGRAVILHDEALKDELWNAFADGFFPDGKEDPNVVVVKVTVSSAEYWEQANKLSSLLQIVKGAVTDSPADPGESGKLSI